MMWRFLTILLSVLGQVIALSSSTLGGETNLVADASFESPTPVWFQSSGAVTLAKEVNPTAADGSKLLVVRGWEEAGSKLLSYPLEGRSEAASVTMKVRGGGHGKVSVGVYSEEGEKVGDVGEVALDGGKEWKTVEGTCSLSTDGSSRVRIGIVISGPSNGAQIEIDSVGFFSGSKVGRVVNNAEFHWFEAENMAGGDDWKESEHFTGWYREEPSSLKMLSGAQGNTELPAEHVLHVGQAGEYRLWARLLRTNELNSGSYTVRILQNGVEVASRTVDDGDASLGPALTWVWVPLDARLEAGDVQVTLSHPGDACSWVARKLDLFLLTNLKDYEPQIADFRKACLVRFTNKSENQQPFGLLLAVHRLVGPIYYLTPGILGATGLIEQATAYPDKLLKSGESSPWVAIGSFVQAGGNNVQWIATRESRTEGLVKGNWKGTMEFAIGDDRKIIKTIEIDQNGPRLRMTLPHIFDERAEGIMTSLSYVQESENVLDKIKESGLPVAKYLDLNTIFGLQPGVDDAGLVEREIGVLKRLGFNGTYAPLADSKETLKFQEASGLPHFGLWLNADQRQNECWNQPDIGKLPEIFRDEALAQAPNLDKVHRLKLSDEPTGPSYEHIASCSVCQTKFTEFLKERGVPPEQVGASSWSEVRPAAVEDQVNQPERFYYTGLFRLWSFANYWRTVVGIKRQFFPDNVNTYVNYAPPHADSLTWNQRSNDLIWCQRDGGLEMGWTEDWLGYGGSPQQMASAYALLRAAGGGGKQPLGGYMVASSGDAAMQRLKYYTLLAAGARTVSVYAYGPKYATIDAWSDQHEVFPILAKVQHEFGAIDEALHETFRRKADIAILYNRTSSIWSLRNSTAEQESNFVHWALAHAGYDADFIPEEDVGEGALSKYRVLYLNGIHLERSVAMKIAEWVRQGGTLFAGAGAATRDEFNRPLDILDEVFGNAPGEFQEEEDAGRPKYEMRNLRILDSIKSTASSGVPAVKFPQVCFRETLLPGKSTTILKSSKGRPVGTVHRFGRGTAIRCGALPGIAYMHGAVSVPGYDAETYRPQNYSKDIRDFIVWPARLARVEEVAVHNSDAGSISRYDSAPGVDGIERSVVFAVDYTGKLQPDFKMVLPEAAQFTKAFSAQGAPVRTRKLPGGKLEVAFPLNIADAIVLEKMRISN